MGGQVDHSIRGLADLGLLGPDTTYVHCCESGDDALKLVADSGGTVSLSPFVELLMGHGPPAIGRLLAHGLRPTLSVDVVSSAPGDLFTQMRIALCYERFQSFTEDLEAPFGPTLTHRDVLRFATLDGAAACGLGHKVGSITPGKDADVVLVRADQINTMPLVDPARRGRDERRHRERRHRLGAGPAPQTPRQPGRRRPRPTAELRRTIP